MGDTQHLTHIAPLPLMWAPAQGPGPVMVEGIPKCEVAKIVASCRVRLSIQYCVDWKGYPAHENIWVPARDCTNFAELVEAFHRTNPAAPRPSLKVTTLLNIKLPKVHKNFVLAYVTDGGITPQ